MSFPRRVVSLHSGWRFREGGSAEELQPWRSARPLPTDVYLDLLHNNVVPDISLAKNEDALQWIGEQIWTYEAALTVPQDAQSRKDVRKVLVFEGLDTYATVKLDGQVILEATNMFLGHRVDITDLVDDDTRRVRGKIHHVLEIVFDNAERRGDDEVDRHPEYQWTTFNSGAGRLATRKAQYHYVWDWGPKLMVCGPWKPIHLECYQSRIVDFSATSKLSSDHKKAILNFTLGIEGSAKFALLDVSYAGIRTASIPIHITESTSLASLEITNPELWWPHTFGKQAMYRITDTLYDNETGAPNSPIDVLDSKHGIRQIELVRKPFAQQEGESFFFRVNGQPIFCAGSNWIPADTSLARITPEQYRRWVQLARDSNQVMLRVWGGGAYEHTAFYDACDDLGILVWHDFMFACGMFPAYDAFLSGVRPEAEASVRALRHHPCLALWCGNNEDYVIPLLSNIEYDADEHDPEKILASVFPARYTYEHLLPSICADLAPDVPYWPGSPFGGAMVNSTTEGDCHQWHVWHLEKFPYQDYPRLSARFVSEFGMQGMPCFETVREFFPPSHALEDDGRDWGEDEYIAFHNKCGGGLETLHEYCSDNLNFSTHSLRRYIYSSQLIQSETATAAYRSWRRQWRGPGEEYCGGALIWQLNDCWPVTSWALADCRQRPKMAYWGLKRENQPITAGVQRIPPTKPEESMAWDLWAVNVTLEPVVVTARVRAWNVSTGATIGSFDICRSTTLLANRSTELGRFESASLGYESTQAYRDVVIAVELLAAPHVTKVVARSINFHEPLKEVPFASINPRDLTVELVTYASDAVGLEIRSAHALKAVFIETEHVDDVHFDENGFDVLPHELVQVGVQGLSVGEGHRLRMTWLGGEWTGVVGMEKGKAGLTVKASL